MSIPQKTRYRLKVDAPLPSWVKMLAPNCLTFVAYNLSATVLSNVGTVNAVLAPFNISVTIEQA
jgi:hypothetical protein